ncbi:Sodium/calcium exchanger NCL1 [Geodia barretti]|nr:Sodium/calcium exchanger NCL1 [Geodia barretti]
MFAAKKTKINTSLTFSQLYGAVTMNNTLGLGIFAALVYFQNLDWQYSAEVTVILFMEFTIGIAVIIAGFGYKHTYIVCFSS